MAAAKFDLIDDFSLKQGETYSLRLRFRQQDGTPYDFTGATAIAHLRRQFSDPNPAAIFTVAFDMDATNGWITMTMSDTVLAALLVGRYVWDIFFEFVSGETWCPLEGDAVVRARATYVTD